MRFFSNILFLAIVAVLALAATTEQRPVIVSYPKGTPDHIIEEAMETVRKAVSSPTEGFAAWFLLTPPRAAP